MGLYDKTRGPTLPLNQYSTLAMLSVNRFVRRRTRTVGERAPCVTRVLVKKSTITRSRYLKEQC